MKTKWSDDPLRELLKEDCQSRKIPDTMKPMEAWKLRPEYEEMGKKLFSSRLSGMRKSLANGTSKNKKKNKEKWNKKSPIWQQLKVNIVEKTIPENMSATTAQNTREIYKAMPEGLFKARLSNMRKLVKVKLAKATEDAYDLFNDRIVHPKKFLNARGDEPDWSEHEAKDLLDIDLDNNLHESMTPEEL